MSFEAENGAVHWFHTHRTATRSWYYQFWQETANSPIYAWQEGWENWRMLPDFNPTPGNFAFVTDAQWIAQVLQIKKQPTQCDFPR